MRKVYYKWMRNAALSLGAALCLLCTSIIARQSPAPIRARALDSHEGMTVAVEPWTSPEPYKGKFPKKLPIEAGVVGLKVSFRNDSAESIKINLERIRLMFTVGEDSRQELRPLSSEDVADAVLKPGIKDPTSKPKLPIPLPSSKARHDKNWTAYAKAAEDAGIHASVVAPHSTVEGLLYFDLQGQMELLNNARLYIPEMVSLEKNHALLYFDIDLSRSSAP